MRKSLAGFLPWVAICVLDLALAGRAADAVPLGHKDFYPSDERPIGFRGDGNGVFPGATPVTTWQEGDVAEKDMGIFTWGDAGGNVRKWATRKAPAFTNDKRVNIVWKTEMPGFSEASPVVVGDRVFCMADPFVLVCVDVNTGGILWQADVNPFDLMGLPKEEVERLTQIMEIAQAIHSIRGNLVGNYGRLFYPFKEFTEDLREPWLTQVSALAPLAEKAQKLGADGADKVAQDVKDVLAALRALKPGDTQDKQPALNNLGGMHLIIEHPLRRKYGLYICDHWAGMVNHEFSTPVSDGSRVYISCGMGQVACYDLNGQRLWGRHIKVEGMENGKWRDFSRCAQCVSPLLIGDLLVVQQIRKLMAFDKKTGKVVWENSNEWNHYSFNTGTHKHVRLADGGRTKDLIVTNDAAILDVATGKELGRLVPYEERKFGDSTPAVMAQGDRVYFGSGGLSLACYRLKLTEGGTVEAERVVDYSGLRVGGTGLMLTEGRIFTPNGAAYGAEGSLLTAKGAPRCSLGGLGPVLAGNFLVGLPDSGTDCYCRLRGDEQLVTAVQVLDMSAPSRPILKQNYLGGLSKPHVRHLERQAPEFYAKGWQVNTSHPTKAPWSMEAVPPQFGYASPAAQGNRLFIRSLAHLYCIGDPNVPYDWNPASRRQP